MEVRLLTALDVTWETVAEYAQNCSWRAGKSLAQHMRENAMQPWERVIALFQGDKPIGFCTLVQVDCLQNTPYYPYIGYVFVDERYRGRRLCGKLLEAAGAYAGEIGFSWVYLVSDHVGLYEKFGFVPVDSCQAPWDSEKTETIYAKKINR